MLKSTKLRLGAIYLSLFVLGLGLRWYGIAGKPFWMDEVTTIRRASLGLGPMVRDSLLFHQLPLYFIITSWTRPLGSSEFDVRLPAMVFGALACALGFGVARRLGGLWAGWAAGLLLALSPAMVQYGQEARSYTLLICGILVGLWGLLALADDPPAAARPMFQRDACAAWAAYVLGTAAALNTLSDALFWFAAANLGAIAMLWRGPPGLRWNWLIAQLVIVVLSAPWFIAIKILGQRGALGGLDWVPPLDLAHLWWSFASTYALRVTSLITLRIFAPGLPGIGLLAAALALAGAWSLRRRPSVLAALAGAILVLPLGLIAISLVVAPVLMPRYLLWSAAPFFVCAGLGVTVLPARLQPAAVALLAVLLAINLRPYYSDETKPLWNVAGAKLHAQLHPGDLVLTNDPQAIGMMNLYLARSGTPITPSQWTMSLAQAMAWRASGHRVWAVQGRVGQADHENRAQFLQRIAPLGTPDVREPVGLDILMLGFG